MWLLDVDTIRLVHFQDDRKLVEKYAILSHTWEDEEVTFQEIHTPAAREKKGFKKIEYACQQAIKDGLQYAWVDTCCINKDSSAELSEAINSMWRWYWNSRICYAYLSDMTARLECDRDALVRSMDPCRWFTRGWTLQELIAPPVVQFFDSKWQLIDSRYKLSAYLSHRTKIHDSVLRKRSRVFDQAIATRLSWAAQRNTTREEDEAYCLLGLFQINMPLLYGEGSKAFTRLQEEIIRNGGDDQSILAWSAWEPQHSGMLLAPRPFGFRQCKRMGLRYTTESELELTSRVLRGTFDIVKNHDESLFIDLGPMEANSNKHPIIRLRNGWDDVTSGSRIEVVRSLHGLEAWTTHQGDTVQRRVHNVSLLRHGLTTRFLLEFPETLTVSPLLRYMSWTCQGMSYILLKPTHKVRTATKVLHRESGEYAFLHCGLDAHRHRLYVAWHNQPSRGQLDVDRLCPSRARQVRHTTMSYEMEQETFCAEIVEFPYEEIGQQARLNQGWLVRITTGAVDASVQGSEEANVGKDSASDL